jgi:bifunctional UDP-N-acetylglucosamine pyrophosphorylase/glucosamine-1-phosphate N-acetyltransferase
MLPLSANIPKHLLPIGGKPLIFHTLENLQRAGIQESLVIIGYRGEVLREAIDGHEWDPMVISYEQQKERKGTAHAAALARDFAGDESVLLMYGDVMSGPDTFKDLIDYHSRGEFSLTISVFPVENPNEYGVVMVEDGEAVGLIEKPTPKQSVGNLVNAGMFCAEAGLWDAIEKTGTSSRGEYEITDSFLMLIESQSVGAFQIENWWVDVGRPWDLLEVNKHLLDGQKINVRGNVEEGSQLKGNVVVEKGATVRNGAYVQGPVYIGEGSVVGPNCYLRPHTFLSKNVKVGNGVEIKNSIVMDNSSIGHLSYVGDSVIGRRVNFGAGTTTANLRHDDNPIWVTVKGKRENTGRRKLGAIVGDNVKFGIGTLLSPGVVVHDGARTGMGVVVEKDIESNKLVLAVQKTRTFNIDTGE